MALLQFKAWAALEVFESPAYTASRLAAVQQRVGVRAPTLTPAASFTERRLGRGAANAFQRHPGAPRRGLPGD